MREINEKRNEKRLVYRWPVRFNNPSSNISHPAQIVDLTSNTIAFLCYADKNCPQLLEKLNTSFAVPHFNKNNSFDTVFLERLGHVQRIDNPGRKVARVVVKFIEPLFFEPGLQEISEADIEQRLGSKALSMVKAEENAKAYRRALAQAEQKIRIYAEAKAQAEEKLRSEIEQRYKSETALKIEAEQKLVSYVEIAAKAKEKAANETKAREKAEKMADFYAAELEKIRAKLTIKEKNETETTTADTFDHIKAKPKPPVKEVLMNKVDKFIADKNKIF